MLKSDGLPKIFWLWIPVLAMIVQLILEFTLPENLRVAMVSEDGPHEILQFLVMISAFGVGVFTLRHIDWKTQKWLGLWLLLATLCSFYVAGEEISWGQQFVHWATPAYWDQVNDQHETNLHNTSSWLDQKPRMLLEIGIMVGGIIFPLMRRYKPGKLPQKYAVIYPPDILAVTALGILFIRIVHKVDSMMPNIVIFERASEVQELYMFYFVLLYMIILRGRILSKDKISP